MQRFAITAICLACFASFAIAQEPQPANSNTETAAPPATFEAAQQLAGKGLLDKSMAMLDVLAAQSPEPAGTERLRGMIFYQQDQFSKAIDAFAKAAEQNPSDRESIEMRGVALFRSGHAREAIPYLEEARVAVARANVDPEYVLGLCYADVARYDDARHAFAAQYGFPPDSAEAYLLAGRLFLRREMRDEAATQARKALEVNAKLPLAHELLGESALASGDLAGAIRELEAERKINPLNPDLYDRLGDAYLRSGQYLEARTALNRAVLLEPSATGPYILLGQTFLELKEPIQALHYLDRAARMDPANYITHNLLGQAYKAIGQLAEANRQFKMVVDLQHQSDTKPAGK